MAVCSSLACQRVVAGSTRALQAGAATRPAAAVAARLPPPAARLPLVAVRGRRSAAAPRQLHVYASWGAPVVSKQKRAFTPIFQSIACFAVHVCTTPILAAPQEFKGAKVLENRREAEQLQRIRVDLGGAARECEQACCHCHWPPVALRRGRGVSTCIAPLLCADTLAGQFVQAKADPEGKAGFFAIASPPGVDKENGVIELLIKAAGEAAERVVAAQPGQELLVSAPQGKVSKPAPPALHYSAAATAARLQRSTRACY